MEENASVYRVNPGSRVTGEGRAEFSRAWGPGFEQEGAGRGGGAGGAIQSVRGNYKCIKGTNLTALDGIAFICHFLIFSLIFRGLVALGQQCSSVSVLFFFFFPAKVANRIDYTL